MKFILFLLFFSLIFQNIYEIELRDDAFHSSLPFHIETWYFEAIFENYSIVFMITILPDIFAMIGEHFYFNGEKIYEERKIYKSFFISDEYPLLIVDSKTIMQGYIGSGGEICYNISYIGNNFGINFHFENKTKGWKTGLPDFWLSLPNMRVEGEIFINNSLEHVKGKGYHDHNIFYLKSIFSNGYFDGKLIEENFSIVWGKIIGKEDFIIFSNESFFLIDNISISMDEYIFDHGRIIPTSFYIYGKNSNVEISLNFKTKSIHYIKLPFINYWRYHVAVTGKVFIDGFEKEINSFEIMEYMKF
ncbi:MAG: hypothetical protein H5T45_00020 [Thermoplasmatales archaeon]|nr:hypothetical protein [Thermoplasmatales archaeon]